MNLNLFELKTCTLKKRSSRTAFKYYVSFIKAKNYKSRTNYTTSILEFLFWAEKNEINNLNNISYIGINKYFDYLRTRPKKRFSGILSDSSIKGHLLALNIFFELMSDIELISTTFSLPGFNLTSHKTRNILSIEQIMQLKHECSTPLESALINLAYGAGLRRTELVLLNVKDVILTKCYVIVRIGKNNKRREVPLPEVLIGELQDYIINYRPQLLKKNLQYEKAFFINKASHRMDGSCMNKILKKIGLKTHNYEIINKNISLHCLRHSIATHLQEAGANIEFIRDFLGHSEIDTTQLYMIRRKKRILI